MKIILLILLISFSTIQLMSQNPGDVVRYKKIANNQGNLGNVLSSNNFFGLSLENIGDINNDGITDLAAGVHGLGSYGGLYILFMDTNGTVQSKTLLTQNTNGISGLQSSGYFGIAVSTIGDINNDGTPDIVVGALGVNDGGTNETGAIYIICLDSTGAAISQSKISKTHGNAITGGIPIQNGSHFGCDISYIGDLNNDGNPEIAVGNSWDDQSGSNHGAMWVLSIDSNKKVSDYYKIRKGITNFNPSIDIDDYFGQAVAGINDFDGDGINDIAVGALYDDDGSGNAGAVYIIHLDTNSHVKSYSKISNNSFTGTPISGTFGTSITLIPDISGDGHDDLAVGASRHPYSSDMGAVYIIKIDSNESVSGYKIITSPEIPNPSSSRLGRGICCMNDYNSDGYPEIVASAPNENSSRGAIYIMSIKSALSVQVNPIALLNCHGDSNATVVATGVGASPPFTYLWSNNSTNDTISNLTAGTYTVTITNSANATSTASITITQPAVLLVISSPDTAICKGDSISISASVNGGTGSKTFYWDNGLGNGNSHIVSPIFNTIYDVFAMDANSCISNTSTIYLTSNPLPAVSFSGPSLSQCLNDSTVALVGIPLGGSYNGPGVSGSNYEPSIAGVGIHQIIYNYTDTNGCFSADSNFTLVNALPTAYAGKDTIIPCGSQGAIIGEGYQSGYTYLWSPYAGLNSPFISNPTANPWLNTSFIITKTSLSTLCSNTDTVVINLPSGLPSISISGDTNLCMGDSLFLIANSSIVDSILWDYGITGSTFNYLPISTQYIHVEVIDSNLCISKDSALVIVNALPIPNLGADTNIRLIDTLTLSPGNYQSYLWSNGSQNSSIDIIGSVLGLGNHSFAVSVVDNNGCSGSDATIISVIVDGIESGDLQSRIKLYPNPSNGIIHIEWDKSTEITQLNIFDLYGKKVNELKVKQGLNNATINMKTVSKGVYIINLIGDDFSENVKIIIK